MGDRGPLAKDERSRKRDNVDRDKLVADDVLRGPDLPTDFAPEAGWHAATLRWWNAFRASPMAKRVQTDVQWETLAGAMLLFDEYLTMGARGRTMRMTEFRAFFASYFITPGDLRRNGLEIVEPDPTVGDGASSGPTPGTVSTSFVERRQRILGGDSGDEQVTKKPAKKKSPAKKAAAKKPAAKKPVAKK